MSSVFCIPWDDGDDETEQVPAKVCEPEKMPGWGAGAFSLLGLFLALVLFCAGVWFQQDVDRWPHYSFSLSLGALGLGAAHLAGRDELANSEACIQGPRFRRRIAGYDQWLG